MAKKDRLLKELYRENCELKRKLEQLLGNDPTDTSIIDDAEIESDEDDYRRTAAVESMKAKLAYEKMLAKGKREKAKAMLRQFGKDIGYDSYEVDAMCNGYIDEAGLDQVDKLLRQLEPFKRLNADHQEWTAINHYLGDLFANALNGKRGPAPEMPHGPWESISNNTIWDGPSFFQQVGGSGNLGRLTRSDFSNPFGGEYNICDYPF